MKSILIALFTVLFFNICIADSTLKFPSQNRTVKILADENTRIRKSSNEFYLKNTAEKRKIKSNCYNDILKLRRQNNKLKQEINALKRRSKTSYNKPYIVVHD